MLFYIDNVIKNEESVDFDFVNELVKKGVALNYLDNNRENVLYMAVRSENEELVKFCLSNNVNAKQRNNFGWNVFHVASKNCNSGIVKLLAEKFDS